VHSASSPSVVWAFHREISLRIRESFASALAIAFCVSVLAGCAGESSRSAIPTAQVRTPADDCNNYQSVHRSGASSSRSLLYTQCPSGGDPGSGTGGGSGGGGGNCVSAGTCPKTSCTDDPTQPKCQVAVYKTPPVDGQKCGNNPGSGYGYHDNLGTFSNGTPEDVQNINEVWNAAGNMPYANSNGQLAVGAVLIGWFYQDQFNNVYFQANPNNGWYASYSVGVNAGQLALTLTFQQIPSTTAQALFKPNGTPLTSLAPMPSGQTLGACWQQLGTMLPQAQNA